MADGTFWFHRPITRRRAFGCYSKNQNPLGKRKTDSSLLRLRVPVRPLCATKRLINELDTADFLIDRLTCCHASGVWIVEGEMRCLNHAMPASHFLTIFPLT